MFGVPAKVGGFMQAAGAFEQGGAGGVTGRLGNSAPAVLCLDVGGSSVKSGVVLANGNVVVGPERAPLKSKGPAEAIVASLAQALAGLHARAAGLNVVGIGVSMPGPFDYQAGVSHMSGIGKFDAIHGLPLASAVASYAPQLAGLLWRWLNDAQAFALGELRFGAAAGAGRAMFITLGTGCGSAFAVNGHLVTSGPGVPPHGYVYPLRYKGRTVDVLLSARGLVRLYTEEKKAAAASGAQLGPGSQPGRLSAQKVGELAAAADPAALKAMNRFGALIASALGPVFSAFKPDVVVVGGQISRSLPHFGAAAAAAGAPQLVPAAAADLAALRGAAVHFLAGHALPGQVLEGQALGGSTE